METQKRFRRYGTTRRFTGRRGITPIKTRQKRLIPKTRRSSHSEKDGIIQKTHSFLNHRHRVEDVPISKHADADHHEKREEADKNQHSENQERKGNQGGQDDGKREDTQKHSQVEPSRDAQNRKESIHPGTLQAVHRLSEPTAFHETSDKTEIEAEELPPL